MALPNHMESTAKLNLVCRGQDVAHLSPALTEQLRRALVESRLSGEWVFFAGIRDTRLTGQPGIRIMQRTSIGLRISLTTELPGNVREVVEGILYGPAIFSLIQVHSVLIDKVMRVSTKPVTTDEAVLQGSVILESEMPASKKMGQEIEGSFFVENEVSQGFGAEVRPLGNKRPTQISEKLKIDAVRYRLMVAEIKKIAPGRGKISRVLVCKAIGKSQGRRSGRGTISSLQALINRGYLTPKNLSSDQYRLVLEPRVKGPPLVKKEIKKKIRKIRGKN
jgi:hypothetical protein